MIDTVVGGLILAVILLASRFIALYAVHVSVSNGRREKIKQDDSHRAKRDIVSKFMDWCLCQRVKYIAGLTIYGRAKDLLG